MLIDIVVFYSDRFETSNHINFNTFDIVSFEMPTAGAGKSRKTGLLEIPQTSLKYPTKMTLSLWRLACAAGPAKMVPCAVESALRRKISRRTKGREDHHCRSIPKSIQRLPKGLWVSPTCPAKMTLSLWFVGGVREGMDL